MVFTGSASTSAPARPDRVRDDTSYFNRWLKIWITLLAVVVVVVVGYLVAITSALSSINHGLARAANAVGPTGAGGNVKTLPDQIAIANDNLTKIDTALKPIRGQADQIIAPLGSIDSKLGTVAPSLVDTSNMLVGVSGSLVNTDSSLKNTSGMLVSVLGFANSIDATLESAENPTPNAIASGFGAADIFQRVAKANGVLAPARTDTANIVGALTKGVNPNLTAICKSLALQLLGGAPPC